MAVDEHAPGAMGHVSKCRANWFNTRRLLEPLGYVAPREQEARDDEQADVA